MVAELLEEKPVEGEEKKLDESVMAVLVVFDARGEASVSLNGVTPQQVLTAGALLTTMAQHMLEVRFGAEEQRQMQNKLQEMLLTRQVAQDLKRGKRK